MKLSDLGEFGLIHRIAKQFAYDDGSRNTGIGDDCAVIAQDDERFSLVTTDMLIEDRHFLLSRIKAWELGHKSLAVNLSDIAAMGGKPQYAFLSLGLPGHMELNWLDEFFLGVKNLCSHSQTQLLGGDTTRSPERLVINFMIIGTVGVSHIKRRSMAQVGDILCVTDTLGDSIGGLHLLSVDADLDSDAQYLINRHHQPWPHLEEGQWLAHSPAVHAMMDVSDGVASDIHRIMGQASVGARIQVDQVPISDTLGRVGQKFGWATHELALGGGEDYCLMLTVNPRDFKTLAHDFWEHFGRPLYPIGEIVPPNEGLSYWQNGQAIHFLGEGFDHFK
ncbi:MAG: thiamine-phosphate kinase [Bacteroidia bacterium]|nr:thiamine-phosphate kinase [Bacteroidia bacterium]